MQQPHEPHEDSHKEESAINGSTLMGIGLAVLLATATFFSGLHIGYDRQTTAQDASIFSFFTRAPAMPEGVDLDEFWRVWNLLEDKYVVSTTTETLTDQEKVHGAIEGLVRSYNDPYTVFLPPVESEMFHDDISGNFSGVGMEVGMRNDFITVVAPLPDSPAERAGLRSGDVIVRIDGQGTEKMNIDEAVHLIRGEEGTEVVLTLYREGETEFTEVSITRATITIPIINTTTIDDAFVIALYSFNAQAEIETRKALQEFARSGKENLILDLRGNPGGYLQSAVGIASYFLPVGKTVVREHFGDDAEEDVYRSFGKELGDYAPKQMVILVDEGSASASEILAGALQEHGVATVIGAQTFGKGSVQELVELDDGSSLKVTVARWLTPNGRSISDGGLTPDIVVEVTLEDREAGRDPQLAAALASFND